MSSNLANGEVYSIQMYMIKLFSDLRQVGGFLQVLRFPPPIKLTTTIITETLLKVALNTIVPSHLFLMHKILAEVMMKRKYRDILLL